MPINWWMDKEDVVYIYNGILLGNEKEWDLAICGSVDGTGRYYAKWKKLGRARQIPYVFTHMWILRNLTEDHGGGEEEKHSYKPRGRKVNHKRLLNTENKLRVDGAWGRGESGWWASRRAPVGMSTGCCMETNLTINYIFKKRLCFLKIHTCSLTYFDHFNMIVTGT